ncbi:protection of telomeres protein 1-like protein, partial [Aphelenchoides avenae]
MFSYSNEPTRDLGPAIHSHLRLYSPVRSVNNAQQRQKSGGSLKDYTALAKLHQRKGVSVFGYVQEVAYAFNTDHHGQAQHEHRLLLTDPTAKRPVPFSLFLPADDNNFRGQLRVGIYVRVHRATCRKTDGGMWLFGKAGVAGMDLVGFELTDDVLNVVCTTSASFSFTRLHHDILKHLQSANKTDLSSDVFAFRRTAIAQLVQDKSDASGTTYAIESRDENLKPGESPPLEVITLDEEEQEDAEVSKETAATVNDEPIRQEPDAMESQLTEGMAAMVSNTQSTEVVNDTLLSPVASPSSAEPTEPKRPRMAPMTSAQPVPVFRNLQTLRSAQVRSYFDVICEVVGVLDNGDYTILRVWDGTKPTRSTTKFQLAPAIAVDSMLEVCVTGYWVDIVCYDDHAKSAKGLVPHDRVSIVNVHAYVNKLCQETLTMHGGFQFGRAIQKLEHPQLIGQLERQPAQRNHVPPDCAVVPRPRQTVFPGRDRVLKQRRPTTTAGWEPFARDT